jgi:hypothetical protein
MQQLSPFNRLEVGDLEKTSLEDEVLDLNVEGDDQPEEPELEAGDGCDNTPTRLSSDEDSSQRCCAGRVLHNRCFNDFGAPISATWGQLHKS